MVPGLMVNGAVVCGPVDIDLDGVGVERVQCRSDAVVAALDPPRTVLAHVELA
jgi:hypothetical protein